LTRKCLANPAPRSRNPGRFMAGFADGERDSRRILIDCTRLQPVAA
jgi:hypothetical protein